MARSWRISALLTALMTASGFAVSDGPPAATMAPVIIQVPRFTTPVETAGTGLSPAVSVRLTVSPSGSVSQLEVTSIEPSTEYDTLFERAVLDSAPEWRFAPALQDDRPVERQLSWQLEFRPATTNAYERRVFSPSLTSLVRDEEREVARLMKVFTLALEKQAAHLQHLIEEAEKPLEQQNRRALSHGGVIVITDHPDKNAAQAAMNTVHAASNVATEVFGQGIPLDAPQLPLMVYIYRSRDQYNQFVGSIDGILESSGMFCPPGLIAIHAEHFSSESILSSLIHEVVHAVMYRRIVKPGQVLPRWLSEGIADYLANSKIKKGVLHPGEYSSTDVFRGQAFLWRGRSIARMSLDQVRRRMRDGKALSLRSIVSADRETFYGENIGLYYAQAWVLVHFLRHGQPEWRTQQFQDFLLYMAEGFRSDEALEAVYGIEPADLESPYREHVASF